MPEAQQELKSPADAIRACLARADVTDSVIILTKETDGVCYFTFSTTGERTLAELILRAANFWRAKFRKGN